MSDAPRELSGPDLASGVPLDSLARGIPLLGHAQGEAVLLVRNGDRFYATGATCTHYGGPLVEGLVAGGRIRCPWHHACFDLASGRAVGPPAFAPIAAYRVEVRDGRAFVREKLAQRAAPETPGPASILIVGGGAAGFAAADTLRTEGYRGPVTMLTAEESGPVDRPNLSKEYLAGKAPEDWIPLPLPADVALRTGTRVAALDPVARRVTLASGESLPFGALLLATGATPGRLDVPGHDLPHVHTLRTFADSRAIVAAAEKAKSAVVVGAGFIGLEAAASLRQRGLAVHVVAPGPPLARVLGPEAARFVQALHERQGVAFHIGEGVAAIGPDAVTLAGGARLAADLVVAGVGVRPATELARGAGLAEENGVFVDARMETSAKGIYAAGDAARYVWRGERIRVEHWVAAERMGRAAARAMLGRDPAFESVPFFWSAHYDAVLAYVGHASAWDRVDVHGSLEARDATLAYRRGETTLAVATLGRDLASLEAERAFAEGNDRALAEYGRTR